MSHRSATDRPGPGIAPAPAYCICGRDGLLSSPAQAKTV